MDTWFLLYDGTSEDGRGNGEYVGRTTDKTIALKHQKKCSSNPYSVGKVTIITDNLMLDGRWAPNWDKF